MRALLAKARNPRRQARVGICVEGVGVQWPDERASTYVGVPCS